MISIYWEELFLKELQDLTKNTFKQSRPTGLRQGNEYGKATGHCKQLPRGESRGKNEWEITRGIQLLLMRGVIIPAMKTPQQIC